MIACPPGVKPGALARATNPAREVAKREAWTVYAVPEVRPVPRVTPRRAAPSAIEAAWQRCASQLMVFGPLVARPELWCGPRPR
jgi:hypothetical protein